MTERFTHAPPHLGFADEIRGATLRAVWSHGSHQLQWMLYHGPEFERLVQNAPLMTLMDASSVAAR